MGSPHATDREIMEWAKAHDRVVFTHDLDFGILTQDGGRRIQSAALDTLPEAIGFALFMTLLRSDSPQSARAASERSSKRLVSQSAEHESHLVSQSADHCLTPLTFNPNIKEVIPCLPGYCSRAFVRAKKRRSRRSPEM
jgi:hypothetical protein